MCGWHSAARSAASRVTAARALAARWLGAGFPYGTLFVNVVGSYAIGVLGTLALAGGRALATTDARAFLIVGMLGGFTTFSSFSLETLNLARAGNLSGAGGERSAVARCCVSWPCGSAMRPRPRSVADDSRCWCLHVCQ